jgi:hypothetical protein
MVDFPSQAPRTIEPVSAALIDALGPLVPQADRGRILAALQGTPVLEVASVGLEVALPPRQAQCDLSLLLPAGTVPSFAEEGAESLRELTRRYAEHSDLTVWWECDTSEATPPRGAFIRFAGGVDAFAIAESACGDPAIAAALRTLRQLCEPSLLHESSIVGFFPDRRPAAAAFLTATRDIESALSRLEPDAVACVDPRDPLLQHLLHACSGHAISVACDVEGRVAVSAEGSFQDRERAMLAGLWEGAFAPSAPWGQAYDVLEHLLATQGSRIYPSLPPVGLMSGIDHIKVGPGGRVKAYVGVVPFVPAPRSST